MSNLRTDTIADKAGTGPATLTGQHAAKALCGYDGTSVIGTAFNQSSVTDGGTGDYTFNLTNAFDDANEVNVAGFGRSGSTSDGTIWGKTGVFITVSSLAIFAGSSSTGSLADNNAYVSLWGVLA